MLIFCNSKMKVSFHLIPTMGKRYKTLCSGTHCSYLPHTEFVQDNSCSTKKCVLSFALTPQILERPAFLVEKKKIK